MNSFLKNNSTWLSLLGVAVLIVILAFIFKPKAPEYQISANQTLKLINDQSLQVAVKDIVGKQIIDIRPAELFAQGHPEKAINIPVGNLLDKESTALLDRLLKDGTQAIICGSDELQATAPFLLLQELGYRNLKLFKGGFTSANEFKETVLASTETSVLDISAFSTKPVLDASGIKADDKKKPESILPVRKVGSSGGGC
jgi:rhodanese-related sulfurtransferase